MPGEPVITRAPGVVPVPGASPPMALATAPPAGVDEPAPESDPLPADEPDTVIAAPASPVADGRPPPVAGLYGKLPARGDFVERRLSDAFVDRWDMFLNDGLNAAAGVLGERFPDYYLVSPFWRFALSAGVAGPATVVGVFAPSVDKVGRYFPMTVAAEIDAGIGAIAALAAAEPWLMLAEGLIYDALDPSARLETLDDAVAALTVTEPEPAAVSPDGGRIAPAATFGQGLAAVLPLPPVAAVFWTLGSDKLPPRMITFGGLPPAARFAAFLDGAWEGKS